MIVEWSEEKNEQLRVQRWVCFEDVENVITGNQYLDIIEHHNSEKYPNQKLYVVKLEGYIYYVPFVENKEEEKIFLKNIIPSRKLKAQYW